MELSVLCMKPPGGMPIPFFYTENIESNNGIVVLDEDTSKHVISVLRMRIGEQLYLTNGMGHLFTAEITDDHKKRCETKIIDSQFTAVRERKISIAISLIKNATRFEWFLEKAAEIGITGIIPLICERTERQHFRYDRMKNVLVSAMLQSRQTWLPLLQEPVLFDTLAVQCSQQQKFIAHCGEGDKKSLAALVDKNFSSQIILIGPEGDFTRKEIDLALQNHFTAVALGDTRLRTETAGMVSAALLKVIGS